MKKLLSAVNHCHSNNIVHRDLKPENIMFMTPFTDQRHIPELKIIDFGLGKLFQDAKQPSLSGVVGTPYYVAPEVLDGKQKYGIACDCWSLGITLYVMLSGHLPFSGKRHREVFDKIKNAPLRFDSLREFRTVSHHAKNLISGLLEKDPKKRLTCGQALKHEWFTKSNEQAPMTF